MTDRVRSLDSLPYDILYNIVCDFDCGDFVSFSCVNRNTNALMYNPLIGRKCIQRHLSHTKEGQDALNGKVGYHSAIRHLYDIREAFSSNRPFSVAVLCRGSAFLYNQGFLCYIEANEIRVLDVHSAGNVEQVLSIRTVLSRVIPGYIPEEAVQLSLLHYSDGILSFLSEIGVRRQSWLISIDVSKRRKYNRGRVLVRRQISSIRRLFVRNNASYLYFGTHSSLGSQGYHEWAVQGMDLRNGQDLTANPIILEDFAGYEIGQTVCFEIHRNHLYAVSNQVNFEEEEVDWTSFYVWACLAPGRDQREVRLERTWRRQHREGPINDTWTDISLRKDEATERLMILECRREWKRGSSENFRTYYTQPLPFPEEITGSGCQTFAEERAHSPAALVPSSYASGSRYPSMMLLPPNEPLTSTLDASNKPNYEPPKKRLRRYEHAEYTEDDDPPPRDFILAKTKYRTYNPSACSFLDLVNDPEQGSPFSIQQDRLRLRIVSRKRKCPIDVNGDEVEKGLLFPPDHDSDDQLIEGSEERFVSRGIKLWPPEDAPWELTELLCPCKTVGIIHAIADERSLVYSVESAEAQQDIILISFDPKIRFPGLKRLISPNNVQADPKGVPIDIDRPKAGEGRGKQKAVSIQASESNMPLAGKGQTTSSFKTEPAMHLCINRSYWLR